MFRETRAPCSPPASGHADAPGPERQPWFDLAHALARSGKYGKVAEVEAALCARGETAAPSRNEIVRDAIDIACLRARGEQGRS